MQPRRCLRRAWVGVGFGGGGGIFTTGDDAVFDSEKSDLGSWNATTYPRRSPRGVSLRAGPTLGFLLRRPYFVFPAVVSTSPAPVRLRFRRLAISPGCRTRRRRRTEWRRSMGSKPWLIPAPNYRRLESSWETDDDAPGPRCGHSLTAVDASKSRGPRLILFGGATAIEGGASSGVPGISNSPPFSSLLSLCLQFDGVFDWWWCPFFWCEGLAGVTNSVHSYDVNTRKWTRCGLLFIVVDDLRLQVDFVDANAAILFFDWQDSSRGRSAFSEGCTCRCSGWDNGCFPGNKIWTGTH